MTEQDRLRQEISSLKAALYDATDGISGTLLSDELDALRSQNRELVTVLEWLHRKGGLGLDVHERLASVIAKATGTMSR